MRYILDVSGRDLELIKASIVNFERSLDMSTQADFSHITDELSDLYLSLKIQKQHGMVFQLLLQIWQQQEHLKFTMY